MLSVLPTKQAARTAKPQSDTGTLGGDRSVPRLDCGKGGDGPTKDKYAHTCQVVCIKHVPFLYKKIIPQSSWGNYS